MKEGLFLGAAHVGNFRIQTKGRAAFMRFLKFSGIVLGLIVLSVVDLHASPRMNYPGTRARAMGMAFTAIADDASAIWYNPAGIAIGGEGHLDFIAEGSEAIDDRLDTETTPFVAFKAVAGKGGFSLSYFKPYVFGHTAVDTADSWEEPEIIDDMEILSIGGAYTFPYRIRIGGAVEAIFVNTKSQENSSRNGGAATLGAQWVPLVKRPWGLKVQLGGVYRFNSDIDGRGYEAYNKPASWNAGAAVMKSITPLHSNLVFSAQYEKTDFSAVEENRWEYDMVSYGIEWQIALDSFITRMAFRAGMYSEVPEGIDSDFEMNGSTYGIGLRFGDKWGLEYSLEKREWENPEVDYTEDFTLHALAVTYSYNF